MKLFGVEYKSSFDLAEVSYYTLLTCEQKRDLGAKNDLTAGGVMLGGVMLTGGEEGV